MLIQQTV